MATFVRYNNLSLKTENIDTLDNDLIDVRNQLMNDVSWGSGKSDFKAVKASNNSKADWEKYRPKAHLISESNHPRSFSLEFCDDFFDFDSEGVNHFIGTVAGDVILNNAIKTIDVDDFWFDSRPDYFPGPKYGIEGIYKDIFNITSEKERPLLAYSIKPRMGYDIKVFEAVFEAAAEGGADIIEDDERLIDPEYCRFEKRIEIADRIQKEILKKHKRLTLYSANITGPLDRMRERVDKAHEKGIRFVKIDVLVTGFDALRDIAKYIKENKYEIGITVYPDVISRYRNLSRNFVYKMARLCGADIIYAGSPGWSRNVLHSNSLIFECEKVFLRHERLRNKDGDLKEVNSTLATMTNDFSAQSAEIISLIFNRYFGSKQFAFFIGYGISSSEKSITEEVKDIKKRISSAAQTKTDKYEIDPVVPEERARIKQKTKTEWEDYSQYDMERYLGKYRRGY